MDRYTQHIFTHEECAKAIGLQVLYTYQPVPWELPFYDKATIVGVTPKRVRILHHQPSGGDVERVVNADSLHMRLLTPLEIERLIPEEAMTTELAVATPQTNAAIVAAGQVANGYASADVFGDYTSRKAENTLKAQHSDLATFAEYLCAATNGAHCPDAQTLQTTPAAWAGVTWGLVSGFVKWMLAEGHAIGTTNRKLSTVRVYAKMAMQAGVIDTTDGALIRTVGSYGGKEGKRIDEKRTQAGVNTRMSHKKAQHVTISNDQAHMLKTQPNTPQGRRDAVIMCLMLDHGLRVGEVAELVVKGTVVADNKPHEVGFFLKEGTFRFYRRKVDKVQTHRMTPDTLRAIKAWFDTDAPPMGPLLRGSRKGGKLTTAGMTARAITERVTVLGAELGLPGLSAHDCRHHWATRAAKAGTDAFALRDAGGWNSLAMPSRYVEAATVANERVKL